MYTTLNFHLGETAEMIRHTVQQFAQQEISPLAARDRPPNYFPLKLWRSMGELGLLGVTVEEEFGGANLGYLEHVIAMEEISRASASVGFSYGAHSNLCVNQIHVMARCTKTTIFTKINQWRTCRCFSDE